MKTGITVVKAQFLHDFTVRITFSDGKINDVDFAEPFAELQGYYARFRKPAAFKRFKIEDGNLTWGPDEAVVFQIYQLYTGKFPKTKALSAQSGKKSQKAA
jgi:hypothetical protein